MRTLSGYVAVAILAAALSWWAATLRPETLPAAPPVAPGTPIALTPEEEISVGIYET